MSDTGTDRFGDEIYSGFFFWPIERSTLRWTVEGRIVGETLKGKSCIEPEENVI